MLIDIQSLFLDTRLDTKAVQFPDAEEQDDATGGCPEVDDEYAEALRTEEAPAMTIESTVAGGEQSRHQGSEYSAHAMHRRSTNGVVDMQDMVDKLDGKYQHHATHQSDDDSAQGVNEVAPCRDAHQTSQHAVVKKKNMMLVLNWFQYWKKIVKISKIKTK